MMHHLWDTPLEMSVTLIWPLKLIQGHKVNWKIIIIYDFAYVLNTNIGHSMHQVDLSDLENNL